MTDPTPITNTGVLLDRDTRLDGETTPAFASYAAYRDLGPARSLAKVGRLLGKSTTLMEEWSRKHAWVARCEAWDAEMDKERRAIHVEAVRSMAERHVKIAHAFMEKVTARLETLEPEDLTPTQLAQFARESVKIERQALGEPTTEDQGASEHDDRWVVSLLASMHAVLGEREQAAFMEGAAAGAAVAADETVTEPA